MKNLNPVSTVNTGAMLRGTVRNNQAGSEPYESYQNHGTEIITDRHDPYDFEAGLGNLGQEILREVEKAKNRR